MRPRTVAVIVSALAVVLCPPAARAGVQIDPRGVFFHSYSGPSSATEWVHIWGIDGDRRYEFSDVRGLVPYRGSIDQAGVIAWDTTATTGGGGQFLNQNRASQTLVYRGDDYASELWRAPGTDSEFITRIQSREDGDASLEGEWRVEIDSLDPRTGALLGSRTEDYAVTVVGDLVRLTSSDGTYFQGVFETAGHAGFRVVLPGPAQARFRSFEGSETNSGLNVMADLRRTGADSFEAVFLLQTRNAPGPLQDQFVERYTAVRVPAPGSGACVVVGGVLIARRRGVTALRRSGAGRAAARSGRPGRALRGRHPDAL